MTFLRRFRDPPLPRRSDLASEEADSIVQNLTQILRSQSDYASFLPGFGLDDPWQHPITSRSLERLRQQILEQVERYEPRLQEPSVATLPRAPDGSFGFELTGQSTSGVAVRVLILLSRSESGARLAVRPLR